jgi:hypothetical protein
MIMSRVSSIVGSCCLILGIASFAACGDDDVRPFDASQADAGSTDGGSTDGGSADGGSADAGATDASESDGSAQIEELYQPCDGTCTHAELDCVRVGGRDSEICTRTCSSDSDCPVQPGREGACFPSTTGNVCRQLCEDGSTCPPSWLCLPVTSGDRTELLCSSTI